MKHEAITMIGREFGEDMCLFVAATVTHPIVASKLVTASLSVVDPVVFVTCVGIAITSEFMLSWAGLAVVKYAGVPVSATHILSKTGLVVDIFGLATFVLVAVAAKDN